MGSCRVGRKRRESCAPDGGSWVDGAFENRQAFRQPSVGAPLDYIAVDPAGEILKGHEGSASCRSLSAGCWCGPCPIWPRARFVQASRSTAQETILGSS